MTNKINKVVAGIFVCAVSAGATASNSTEQEKESEGLIKIYTENVSEVDDMNLSIPNNDLQKLVPSRDIDLTGDSPATKKRHSRSTNSLGDWWDSLWVKVDPAAKQDDKFS